MGPLSNKWARTVLLAAWVLCTSGCAGPATPARPGSPALPAPPSQAAAADKRFIIAPELANILHVVNVRLNNPPGAYLKIQVTVQNMTAASQHFLYRIDWFDQDGARLPLASQGFMPWMLLPREISPIAAVAPSPAAVDFGIAFVPPDK